MLRCSALEQKRPGYLKACKRCFREFEEFEADVLDVSPATELADYLDSRLHGNDKQGCGNNRGETDIGVEDVNDLCPQCREKLGVMDLLRFGEYIACAFVHIICELQHTQYIPKTVMLKLDTGVRISYMER